MTASILRRRRDCLPVLPVAPAALAVALLGGCASDTTELQAWMDQTRRNTPQTVERIPEPKRFEPFAYQASAELEPFALGKFKVSAAPGRGGSGLKPDTSRRREPLEAFPLDNLKMVGSLRQAGTHIALVQVDTALYQVKVGHHVGQNFGRITRITDTDVSVREVVQDAAGDWVERDTSLRLQETRK